MNSIDGKKRVKNIFYQFCTEFFMQKKVMKGTKAQHGENLTEYIDSGDFHHIYNFFIQSQRKNFSYFQFLHFFRLNCMKFE